MCKTRNVAYVCGHSISFRLSACGGTFTYVSRASREKRSSCVGTATITIRSGAVCGPCVRAARENELNDHIAALKASFAPSAVEPGAAEPPEEVTAAESERDHQLWLLDRCFPDHAWRPGKRHRAPRPAVRSSMLNTEVLPEDVVVKYGANPHAVGARWDDWGDGDVRLEDELAEDRAAHEAAGATVSRPLWAGPAEAEHEEMEPYELSPAPADEIRDADVPTCAARHATDAPSPRAKTPHFNFPRADVCAKENATPTTTTTAAAAAAAAPPSIRDARASAASKDSTHHSPHPPPWHGYRSLGPRSPLSL